MIGGARVSQSVKKFLRCCFCHGVVGLEVGHYFISQTDFIALSSYLAGRIPEYYIRSAFKSALLTVFVKRLAQNNMMYYRKSYEVSMIMKSRLRHYLQD